MQRATVILADYTVKSPTQIFTTNLLKWPAADRDLIFENLRYAQTTDICNSKTFPKIGDNRLIEFWKRLSQSEKCLANVAEEIFSETRRPPLDAIALSIPRISNYFISATPGILPRSGIISISFSNTLNRDLVRVLLNSNVFYWYWRSFGDGFHLNVDIIGDFPLPQTFNDGYLHLAGVLDSIQDECLISRTYAGQTINSYNFNKRMDVLLDIDAWIVQHIAPDLNLPRDIFAQHKSNSFLRPLDIAALPVSEEESDDEGE